MPKPPEGSHSPRRVLVLLGHAKEESLCHRIVREIEEELAPLDATEPVRDLVRRRLSLASHESTIEDAHRTRHGEHDRTASSREAHEHDPAPARLAEGASAEIESVADVREAASPDE